MAATASRDDPTRLSHLVVLAVFSFLALVAVVFRLWARKIKRNVWELSDYLIIMGLVWTLIVSGFTMYTCVYWELGANVIQLGNPEAIQRLFRFGGKSMLVGETTWAVAAFFIRASILALYTRIFCTKPFRTACYITHGVNTAFLVSAVLAICLICRPISFNWDRPTPNQPCGDQRSLDLYLGIFSLLMDVTIIVLPMPVLWGLQMAVKKKLVLSVMFGLGIIICVVTLLRTQLATQKVGSNAQSNYSLMALVSCLEVLLGVVNACLPVMKPVFTKLSSSRASSWISSIMSGSRMIFIRPSQIGSHWRPDPSRESAKRTPRSKYPLAKEMPLVPRWPSSSDGKQYETETTVKGVQQSPSPAYVDIESVSLRHTPPTCDSLESLPMESPRHPIRPKGVHYSPTKQRQLVKEKDPGFAKGIHVRKEWDIERGEVEETDTQGLIRCEARW